MLKYFSSVLRVVVAGSAFTCIAYVVTTSVLSSTTGI